MEIIATSGIARGSQPWKELPHGVQGAPPLQSQSMRGDSMRSVATPCRASQEQASYYLTLGLILSLLIQTCPPESILGTTAASTASRGDSMVAGRGWSHLLLEGGPSPLAPTDLLCLGGLEPSGWGDRLPSPRSLIVESGVEFSHSEPFEHSTPPSTCSCPTFPWDHFFFPFFQSGAASCSSSSVP